MDVVDALADTRYLDYRHGSHDRTNNGIFSRTSRIRPSLKLQDKFAESSVSPFDIDHNYELCLADIEVMLNGENRSAPTLCVTDGHEVIPLNTPDGRPIQMNKANAIQFGDGK